MAKKAVEEDTAAKRKRGYLSQTDVPGYPLQQALRVPQAIADNYGKAPTKPLRVAQAMGMTPTSGPFRGLTGAAIAYGLTEGGSNSDQIAISPLGRRIVSPTKEGDDVLAMREALLRPRVIRDFLTRYNESKLPSPAIGKNVLEELGVPADRAAEVYTFIVDSAKDLGLLRDVKGHPYVDLDTHDTISTFATAEADGADDVTPATPETVVREQHTNLGAPDAEATARRRSGRVFITHGKNQQIVTQLKDLLTFGGFTPIVAIEQETISKPVPDKVLDDMRSCDAAIIHVGTDKRLLDETGAEHKIINQNVLIEIGAAMALYDRKFILLVEKGATLPSNLQGLYEVRYEGAQLDYESTMKLLKAFADFRS